MKHFKYIFIPLVALLLSSCGTKATSSDSSFNSEDSSNNSSNVSTTSTSDGSGGSGGGRKLSARNPMNEPYISEQYYLNHIGDIYNTWKSYQGDGVTIAVIDVGFKADHPDFTYEDGSSKVSSKSAAFTYNTSSHTVSTSVGNSVDNLKNIVTDHGYNDDHGTFCAGIAAAGINGKGVMGIAPLAELMLLKTDGYVASVKEAFSYAANNGAKVITISIGSYSDYDGDLRNDGVNNIVSAFNTAVQECRNNNIVVVSAAGNGGLDYSHSRTAKTYPGATPGVIGVGGLKANKSDKVWEGSSYNASNSSNDLFCDVFAPSDGMFGCCSYNSSKYDGGYDYINHQQKWIGTSFASPIVAGIAALYFDKNPGATVDQFEDDLFSNYSHLFTPGDGLSQSNIGHGRVDVGALLGTTLKTEITAKLKNSGAIYAYYWNSVTGASNTWPGQYLGNYDNHIYDLTMDANKYDSVIFNTGNNSASIQSIDLSISSFVYGNTLDMDQNHELDETSGQGKAFVGTYLVK